MFAQVRINLPPVPGQYTHSTKDGFPAPAKICIKELIKEEQLCHSFGFTVNNSKAVQSTTTVISRNALINEMVL